MQDTKLLTQSLLFPLVLTLSLIYRRNAIKKYIFSHLHEFKVPPDRLGDLWLCDTDRLYQRVDATES